MFKMIVQMHARQEVTEHATIAEARERLVKIAVASNSRLVGDDVTGEFILRDRDGNDQVLGWTFGAYLITEVDPEALVYVVEHADGREEFGSDAEARHFQTTIAPGSSRYSEPAQTAAAPTVDERRAALFARTSMPVLLQSAATLEALASPTPEQRRARAWTYDEIERRVGKITLDEEPEFERVYDETDSYLAALTALRPQLGA